MGLVHLLRQIRDDNILVLRYYTKIDDATISDLLAQASTNNENQLTVFSDSNEQDCTDNGRSTGAYILFYQVVPIDNFTHVPVTVSQ